MTAVLERELSAEVLYQPLLAVAGNDGHTVCNEKECNKTAVWEFSYHTDSVKPCLRWFVCQAHTDRLIARLLKIFDGNTSVDCEACATVFRRINDYVKVVRIP